MALFGKGDKKRNQQAENSTAGRPVVGRSAYCRICDEQRQFTKCWLRPTRMTQCPACETPFQNVGELYDKFQASCPQCGEFLEQPGFEYGLCDACGSKYELVRGTKPGLLPNKQQRSEMERLGKVWRIE